MSIPITLELISLGDLPPKLTLSAEQNHLPQDQLTLSYQAGDLYRAEHIARESAHKLNELPLPATTTNYTLYEKAVPQPNRPTVIRSVVAGNALIAQELPHKTPPPIPTNAIATAVKTDPLAVNIEKILHKDTLATVIKNIPRVDTALPDIVRKQLGTSSPLDHLKAGHNFTLRIDSLAVPDHRPTIQADSKATDKGDSKTENKGDVKTVATVTNAPPSSKTTEPSKSDAIAAPPQGLSGIVIAPGKNIKQHNPQETDKTLSIPSRSHNRYPDHYAPSSVQKSGQDSSFKTLYVATPVSVIKFQSPIDLKPGTIINFSLPKLDNTENTAPGKNTVSQTETSQKNPATDWVATSPVTRPVSASTPELAPQPLEHLVHNWQSLSQIIAVLPPLNDSSITQSLNNRIPGVQNPGQMTSAMVFFLAAMGAKNPARIWLGPKITQQLEKAGQGKLLTMLDNDMQRIFRLGTETPINEWRPALIPLQVGNDISAIPLLVRQLSDDDPDGKNTAGEDDDDSKNNATRFIVEIDLTQFGQLQVDGLLKAKKLNIIIRSKIILPPEMKKHMTTLFTTALEVSGYHGDLQFRDNARPPLSVREMLNQKIHVFKA